MPSKPRSERIQSLGKVRLGWFGQTRSELCCFTFSASSSIAFQLRQQSCLYYKPKYKDCLIQYGVETVKPFRLECLKKPRSEHLQSLGLNAFKAQGWLGFCWFGQTRSELGCFSYSPSSSIGVNMLLRHPCGLDGILRHCTNYDFVLGTDGYM